MIWTYRCPEKVILHNAVTCKSIGADTQRMLTPEFGGISEPALSPQFVHACIDRERRSRKVSCNPARRQSVGRDPQPLREITVRESGGIKPDL